MRLTKPAIEKLSIPPGRSEALFFDDTLAGFGVRLRAGGKRTWVLQYRIGTKQRRVTIGSLQAIDLDGARTEARRLLAKAQLGHDPQADKLAERAKAAQTVGANIDRYVRSKADKVRPSTLRETERYLRVHWQPLHEKALHAITRADISERLDALKAERGGFSADRARAALSGFLTWAARRGLVSSNAAGETDRPAINISRERVLTDSELRAIWGACRADDYGRIIRLLILTGQRRDEIGSLRWSEVSLERGRIELPSSRTKNGRAHEIPLSGTASAVLSECPRQLARDHVFGQAENGRGFSGWSKAKVALDKRIKTASNTPLSPWRLHDLRRTVATRMADLGVQPHVIEALLNHASGSKAGVAGIYNRSSYATEKHQAVAVWEASLIQRIGV